MTMTTLPLHITSREHLNQLYMPFLDAGGLFVPTRSAFTLGQEVTLQVRLPGSLDSHTVGGIVVWLTPAGAQGNRPAGIGVRFNEQSTPLQQQLDRLLAGMQQLDGLTATL